MPSRGAGGSSSTCELPIGNWSTCKTTPVSEKSQPRTGHAEPGQSQTGPSQFQQPLRDLADVSAVEVIQTVAVHLMSAAAIACGLAPDTDEVKGSDLTDLDEARKLITALAGLVTAAAPEIGSMHAASLRDGLKTLQRAFREASIVPDAPGDGPGEQFTGPVT